MKTKQGSKVLLVDDEVYNLKLLDMLLKLEGYVTLAAENGVMALSLAEEHQPDIILLDVMMPDMDGFEVAQQLKSNPLTSNIPIIMVSSLDDRGSRLRALDAGASEFITKPVDRAELKVRVKNLIKIKEYDDFLVKHKRVLNEQIDTRSAEELLHELQVHQVELEMQNETLRDAHAFLELSRDRYLDLYDFAPIGYLSLTADGLISKINLTGAALLGVERKNLLSHNFSQFVAPQDADNWYLYFHNIFHHGNKQRCELVLKRNGNSLFHAQLDALKVSVASAGRQSASDTGEIIVTFSDVTERFKMAQENIRFLQQLNETSRHLISVQEEARRRLSSELHDRTSPNLAAVKINLSLFVDALRQSDSADFEERLDDTRALIADTEASIREICAEMRPPLLDYAGLTAALEGYTQQFSRRTGIEVQFNCLNRTERFTPELESLLFRVCQEALTNCAKHAHATSVLVTLDKGSENTALVITDNGIGFDPAQLGKNGPVGMGMLSMCELAEVAGGHFSLSSSPGKGTRISVEFHS